MNTQKKILSLFASCLASSTAFGIVNVDFSGVTSTDNFLTNNSTVSAGTDILRFNTVASGLDLLITTDSDYTPGLYSNNGLDTNDFGRISMAQSSSAFFIFKLVDAGTTTLATIDEVAFTFLDLDGQLPLPFESMSVNQSSELVLNDPTKLTVSIAGGVATLGSTVEDGGANQPTSTTLTPAQSEIAGSFIFKNTNQFRFGFDTGSSTTGRSVLFAGDVVFDDPANPIVVPEPSMGALLLGLSVCSLVFARRRARKA